jgi:5-methylcytosine-specific restriction endonuclease McrA
MIDKSKLEELMKLGLSTRQIAAEVGKGQTTVRYWLEKYEMYVSPSKGGRKRTSSRRLCLNCNSILRSKTTKSKYCSLKCTAQHQQKLYIDQWLSEQVSGQISGGTLISAHIRNYLLDKANYQCSECGWSKVNPFTNRIPLEINHIDGNFLNNSPKNLEVLCPNCHALKHTYQNRGAGRRAKGYMS